VINMRSSGRPRRRTMASLAGLGLAVLGLAATACGPNSAASQTDTYGLSGTPITIGVIADVTGPTGQSEASAAKVFQAWATYTNQTGGVAGHPVKVVVYDTKEDSPTAVSAARKLIADSSVDAVVSANDNTEEAIGTVLASSNLPVVGGEGYSPNIWGKLKHWFGITTTFPQVVNMQIAAAQPVNASTLSVLACAESPACSAAVPLFTAAAKAANKGYAGTFQVSASAPSYTAQCLSLINDKVQYAQLAVAASVGTRVAQQCQTQGYTGYFGSSSASVAPALYNTPNIKLAGGLNAFPWYVDTPAVQTYRTAMSKTGVAEADWAQPTSTALWATGELFKKALAAEVPKASDAVSRQTVLDAYGKIKNETLGGLLPQPISFSADQPAAQVTCYWLYQFQDGKFAGSATPACGS